ncbi:MAG: exodeoxyribonuclease VII large subunit [Clostridia bacterium]|nr:exodeoxyribonuclease VII large subunit [Clostridia bacterium]
MTSEPAVQKFPGALTVSQLNEYIKHILERDPRLSDIYVKGEISNFKNHYGTGHYYFTLKDETGMLRAVMFKASAQKMPFIPEDGMKVIAHGRISAFVRDGQYQIYCDSMEPDGVGALYIAFEQLKRKLESEGLFDPARKRPLPKIPSRVGIITSPTGAAVRDMINVCGRRFPFATLVLYPSLVQGPDAPPQLIAGMRYFNEKSDVDVIIIGRGGGAIEDLWAFNNEELAREIAASSIPVISAVGHETDFTICDFVADKRAPTPSAAAELAVPDTAELKRKIGNIVTRESGILRTILARYRERLTTYQNSRALTTPRALIDDKKMLVAMLSEKLERSEEYLLNNKRSVLKNNASTLSVLNPLSVLARGFSAVYTDDGSLLKSVNQLQAGEKIHVRAEDGAVLAEVIEVQKNDRDNNEGVTDGKQ